MKDKKTKQLGMIGLGRMGANMVRRLMKDGHECVVYDRSPDAVKDLVKSRLPVLAFEAAQQVQTVVPIQPH